MSYALNRMTPTAVRAGFAGTPVPRGRVGPADHVTAADRVLDDVLDSCGAGLNAMRSGARVTIVRDDRFDAAVSLYREARWVQAFERLAALADQDHAPSAKLALLMLRHGPSLYGVRFAARPTQVARWAQRVLRATSRATASPSSITARA
jgi:hypothetical protein